MDFLDVVVGSIGLLVALMALDCQRKEIAKNGKINTYIHTSELIQKKIDYYNRIINDLKSQNKDFSGHAHKINKVLRPLKDDIDSKLITYLCENNLDDIDKLKKALSLKDS